jgi:hypothetical protein
VSLVRDGLFFIISALALNKSVTLALSVWWVLRGGGRAYAEAARKAPPADRSSRFKLIADHGGRRVGIFGVKSVRLYRNNGAPPEGLLAKLGDFIVHVTLRSAPATLIWCFSFIVWIDCGSYTGMLRWGAVALSFWTLMYSLGLVVEGMVWTLSVHDYYSPWARARSQGASPEVVPRSEPLDVFAIAGLAATAVVSISTLVACSQAQFTAWGANLPKGAGLAHEAQRLFESLYYALGMLVTAGDSNLSPNGNLSYTIAILTLTSVLVIGGLLLSSVFDVLRGVRHGA